MTCSSSRSAPTWANGLCVEADANTTKIAARVTIKAHNSVLEPDTKMPPPTTVKMSAHAM